jgi:S-adenosyl methyltransferase
MFRGRARSSPYAAARYDSVVGMREADMAGLTPDRQELPPEIDTSRPHSARVYDYLLGGKNHFEADRALAHQVLQAAPHSRTAARENRQFLGRVVRYLAAEAGIRQFLDIGTGLPAPGAVHEVAREIAPDCRVVYCDNDPAVVSRARTEMAAGGADYIEADVRDADGLLARAGPMLDLSAPVGVLLVSVLHMISDRDDPAAVVARLMTALPGGSYLVLTHVASDIDPEAIAEMTRRVNQQVGRRATPRDHASVLRLFAGLELVPPGLVRVPLWRPDSAEEAASPSAQWGGVGPAGRA